MIVELQVGNTSDPHTNGRVHHTDVPTEMLPRKDDHTNDGYKVATVNDQIQ